MSISYTQKLKTTFGELTYSEEKLAQYIDEHRSEMTDYYVSTTCSRSGNWTVHGYSLFTKLGYGTFKKMIADITSENPDESIDLEIEEHESTRETNEKIREQYNQILDLTFSYNTDVDIDEAVNYLYHAKKVICCGFSARNVYFAQYFTYKLSSIGIDAFCDENMSLVYSKIRLCTESDVIVILSESGETRDLINFAKMAKKRGMFVITITKASKNTLQTIADKNLRIADYGLRTFLRNSVLRISVLSILDMLFLNLVKKNFNFYEREAAKLSFMTKLDYRL